MPAGTGCAGPPGGQMCGAGACVGRCAREQPEGSLRAGASLCLQPCTRLQFCTTLSSCIQAPKRGHTRRSACQTAADTSAAPTASPALPFPAPPGDEDEWRQWRAVGDPVVHIDLRRWADALVIAPLSGGRQRLHGSRGTAGCRRARIGMEGGCCMRGARGRVFASLASLAGCTVLPPWLCTPPAPACLPARSHGLSWN